MVQSNRYYRALRSLYRVVGQEQSRKLVLHAFGLVIMACLEMILVSSIMPFIQYIESPEKLGMAHEFLPAYVFENRARGIATLGGIVLGLLILVNGFSSLILWKNIRFSLLQDYYLARRILELYLSQKYEYFLKRNSSEMATKLFSDVTAVVSGVLIQSLNAVTKASVVIALIVLVFIKDPVLAFFSTLLLGGSYYSLFRILAKINSRNGKEALSSREAAFRILSEALGGIKEIKLASLENSYLERFATVAKKYADRGSMSSVLSHVPRYLLETIAFGGMIGLILYLALNHQTGETALSGIALYAFAGYRMMPAMQAVYSAMMDVKHYWPAVEKLEIDILELKRGVVTKKSDAQGEGAVHFEKNIELNSIKFRYSPALPYIFDRFNMLIEKNSVIGFIGKTGSGKTTLVDIILGLLKPESGSLKVDGVLINDDNLPSWQSKIAYVPQSIYLIDDTIECNIAFEGAGVAFDPARIKEAARLANLDSFIESLPDAYETVVGERGVRLSGGQRQRIGIARALYRRPDLLVLDEATSALDYETEAAVMDAIRNLTGQMTILMIAHRLTTLRDCDIVYDLGEKVRYSQNEIANKIKVTAG